jgi:hypothetical protein
MNFRIWHWLITLTLILFCTSESHAQFRGVELYRACTGTLDNSPADQVVCLGYIRGFAEGLWIGFHFGEQAIKNAPPSACCSIPFQIQRKAF